MEISIHIEDHALMRMIERGIEWDLDLHETRKRVFDTVLAGNETPSRHASEKHTTYVRYFGDGLCFYVICDRYQSPGYVNFVIKTVIIEEGRP